jgi:hypothetical protein
LTHEELNGAVLTLPAISALLNNYSFLQIHQLPRYWQDKDRELTLDRSMEDFVTSLHSQGLTWVFLLRGTRTGIESFFCLPHQQLPILNSVTIGSFPGIQSEGVAGISQQWLNTLQTGVALTGIPSISPEPSPQQNGDRINKLCRGLYGSNWAYVVYSEPLPKIFALNSIEAANRELSRISEIRNESTYQDKRSIDLLEHKVKYLEQARQNGLWATQTWLLTDNMTTTQRGAALLHSAFAGSHSVPEPIRTLQCRVNARNTVTLEPLNTAHVATLTCLPSEEYPGYELVDYTRFGAVGHRVTSGTRRLVNIGEIIDRGAKTNNNFQIPLNDLTKHGLIVGVTGSGKTNTCFNLLEQIDNYGVPFLVIESAKSEYRELLKHPKFKDKLKVFTIGDETTSPLRLNPFEVPKGILIQTHIDYLKSLFSAAFTLPSPTPYILELGIQEIYQERGWDLAMNTNRYGEDNERRFPTLSDLVEKVQLITDRSGYTGEILSNIKSSLVVRLDQLRSGGGKGPMFNTRRSVSLEDIFNSPCIFELKQVISDDEKAFFMGLILINLHEYHEVRASQGKIAAGNPLHHITLIEEAHRLLRNTSTEQGGETANPQGRAIEVFTNILAEIRAYGEGILIAEQLPVKLTPDAIKNTNLKVVHRLVSKDDREVISATLDLDEAQQRYLTRLEKGSAIVYAEGLQKSVQVSIPLASCKDNGSKISAIQLKQVMDDRFWSKPENSHLRMTFSECKDCPNNNLKGRSCGAREAGYADRLLLDSFRKLFNTLRFPSGNLPEVVNVYCDFAKSCQNHQSRRQQTTSPYCLFVELVNIETEERGRLSQWKYDDIDLVVRQACAIISNLEKCINNDKLSQLVSQEIKGFSTLINGLYKKTSASQSQPYPGCIECNNACNYRYDLDELTAGNAILNRVEKNIYDRDASDKNTENMLEKLFEEYELVAKQLFPNNRLQDAIICLAAQDAGKKDISVDKQRFIVKSIQKISKIHPN